VHASDSYSNYPLSALLSVSNVGLLMDYSMTVMCHLGSLNMTYLDSVNAACALELGSAKVHFQLKFKISKCGLCINGRRSRNMSAPKQLFWSIQTRELGLHRAYTADRLRCKSWNCCSVYRTYSLCGKSRVYGSRQAQGIECPQIKGPIILELKGFVYQTAF